MEMTLGMGTFFPINITVKYELIVPYQCLLANEAGGYFVVYTWLNLFFLVFSPLSYLKQNLRRWIVP